MRELADLLGEHPELVVRWATPDAKGRPAAFDASLDGYFSFLDLVSAAVVSELRRRDVPDADVRDGVAFLRSEFACSQPLAVQSIVERLGTAGTAFVVRLDGGWFDLGRGGQGAFEDVIKLYLRSIAYDDLGIAARWRPAALIVLDPAIQAGAPCIEGTRVTTRVVADMAITDSAESIADDLEVSLDAVNAAIVFQQRLDEHRGVAA